MPKPAAIRITQQKPKPNLKDGRAKKDVEDKYRQIQARLRHNVPAFVYGGIHHYWGEDDNLPYELLDYLNCTEFAKDAIDFVTDYICGKGFKDKASGSLNMSKLAPIGTDEYLSLSDLVEACSREWLQWGGSFCLLIRRNEEGVIESVKPWLHVQDLRFGTSNPDYYQYYYQSRWRGTIGSQYISLPKYQGVVVEKDWHTAEMERQRKQATAYYYGELLWYKPARFGNFYYPIPNWFSSSEILQASGAAGRALLQKANAQFMPSVIITTPMLDQTISNNGTSELGDFHADLIAYQRGDKPAGIIHLQAQDKESMPQVTTLDVTDLPAALLDVYNGLGEAIYRMFKVNPCLAGYAQPGQLGDNQQMATAEGMLNERCEIIREKIFSILQPIINAYAGDFVIDWEVVPRILHKYVQPEYLDVLTPDEKRIEIGYEPLPVTTDSTSQSTLDTLNSLSPLLANAVLKSMTVNETRELLGKPPIEGGDVLASTTESEPTPAL